MTSAGPNSDFSLGEYVDSFVDGLRRSLVVVHETSDEKAPRQFEHGLLSRDFDELDFGALGGGDSEMSGERNEERERADLLLDAIGGLGTTLADGEDRVVLDFEVLLDLPAKPIDFLDRRGRISAADEVGENDRGIAAVLPEVESANSERLWPSLPGVLRRRDFDDLVDPEVGHKVANRHRHVRLGAHDEVNPAVEELMHDLEGGIAAIQDDDRSLRDSIEHGEQFGSFARSGRCDNDIVGAEREHVEDGGDKDLRAVPARGLAECRGELIGALDGYLGAVHSKEAVAEPSTLRSQGRRDLIANVIDERAQKVRLELLSRAAETGGRWRLAARECDAEVAGCLPEVVEQSLIPKSPTGRSELNEERDKNLWAEDAIASEVASSVLELLAAITGNQFRNNVKKTREFGMGVAKTSAISVPIIRFLAITLFSEAADMSTVGGFIISNTSYEDNSLSTLCSNNIESSTTDGAQERQRCAIHARECDSCRHGALTRPTRRATDRRSCAIVELDAIGSLPGCA